MLGFGIKKISIDFVSKMLVVLGIALFSVVIASQIFLKNKATRAMFTEIEKYENITYESTEKIKKGSVTVSLDSGKPSQDVEIWFNGEKVSLLDEKVKKIVVDCDGVVEIKNDSGLKISVSVKNSDGVELPLCNKIEMSAGIKVLCMAIMTQPETS